MRFIVHRRSFMVLAGRHRSWDRRQAVRRRATGARTNRADRARRTDWARARTAGDGTDRANRTTRTTVPAVGAIGAIAQRVVAGSRLAPVVPRRAARIEVAGATIARIISLGRPVPDISAAIVVAVIEPRAVRQVVADLDRMAVAAIGRP